VKLSKEAEAFIENLHLYLLTSGKKEKEIKEIVEELSDHLREAEANGKNISEVTGDSPKEYMESLAKEMQTDIKEWSKLLPHVFISIIAYMLISKIILGENQLSLLVGMGSIFICMIMIGLYVVIFRYISSRSISNKISFVLMFFLQLLLSGSFFVLMFYGNNWGTVYMIDTLFKQILFLLIPFAYLSWFAWWSKSWIVFLPILVNLPSVITEQLPLTEEWKAIISSIFLFIMMLAFLIWQIWLLKRENKPT
jgi:DNA-binding ferritin-like protein (Dps family)